MHRNVKRRRGSILILTIMMLLIFLTLILSMFVQEMVSEHASIRSYMSASQEQALQTTLMRLLDAFSADRESSNSPPVPLDSDVSSTPSYDIPFSSKASYDSGFTIKGRWKQQNSIYFSPAADTGRDFTTGVEEGYYQAITASGFESLPVPPCHNFVALDTPLLARYLVTYSYSFPYGAFAPSGSITLKDAYGCANPIDDTNPVNGDYPSGVPVDMYAKQDIQLQDYPHGKAYTRSGSITISGIRGAICRTNVNGALSKDVEKYRNIMEDQLSSAYTNLVKIPLDKSSIMYGAKVTNIADFIKGLFEEYITLQQSASFPFAALTCNASNPSEKTMGDYYTFRVHSPYTADSKDVSIGASAVQDSAKLAYKVLNEVQKIFERYEIDWRVSPTEECITQAESELAEDISTTSEELADATEGLPETALLVAALTAKLAVLVADEGFLNTFSVNFFLMRGYEADFIAHCLGSTKTEPKTTTEDGSFNNSGWPFISICTNANKVLIVEQLNIEGSEKYALLGTELMADREAKYRLSHFGSADFTTNFTSINSSNFQFNGTLTVPRGRTLKQPGDLTITGDLWVQDGGLLYVTGSLNVKAPANPNQNIHEMVRPSGRVFLGSGSAIIVDGDFQCAGSKALGSVVLTSPAEKIYTITSCIYSNNGSVTLPYGITPGIAMDELAADGGVIPAQGKMLQKMMSYAANMAKICGPFHVRKSFFASNAASLLVFRHKALGVGIDPLNFPLLMPLKQNLNNVPNDILAILSQAFTLKLNAYLGENFFTHSDWWLFGEGVLPIIPKMDHSLVSKETIELADMEAALGEVVAIDTETGPVLLEGTIAIDAAEVASKALPEIYGCFVEKEFQNNCDQTAATSATDIKNAAADAYMPFTEVVKEADNLKSTFANARQYFKTFCETAYPIMENHLPGGISQKPFVGCPGILIYAGENVNMGQKGGEVFKDFLPASGLIIASKDLVINGSFRMVGCLVSLKGNINATDTKLRFYPYFTRASLYSPKNVGGSLSTNFKLVSDDNLKSGQDPQNVGITLPHIQAEGWDFYSEYSK